MHYVIVTLDRNASLESPFRMRRRPCICLLLLAAACGRGAPIDGVEPLRVTAAVDEVELGRAFPLTVVRAGRALPEWDDAALAPLHVRLRESSRREQGGLVEETRRYDAYAFTLDDLKEPVPLRVKRALDPEDPGPAELPEPLPARSRWYLWLAGAAVALAAVAAIARRPSRPARPLPPAEPAPEPPHTAALERLARLRAGAPRTPEDFVETAALLRDYVGARFDTDAFVLTSQEIAARWPRLADALALCDLVKFARHAPAPGARTRMLDDAEAFVREAAA